jgi:hypothetical protein
VPAIILEGRDAGAPPDVDAISYLSKSREITGATIGEEGRRDSHFSQYDLAGKSLGKYALP